MAVIGEPGMGESRMLHELIHPARPAAGAF